MPKATQIRELMHHWRRARLSGDLRDDEAFRVMGLNRTDGRALDALLDGPLTITELATSCGLSQNAMTTVVDRLAGRGYVQRRRDDTDRRRVAVHRTDYADRVQSQVFGPVSEWSRAVLARYTADELALLTRFMEQTCATQERHLEFLRELDPVDPAAADARRAP